MDYMKKINIPMSSPDITDEEREAVADVLKTNYLSMGPYLKAFEKAICNFTGAKNAMAVSSGTAGLHLCVRACGWEDGDYVITTPFSFVSSANVLLYERVTPIFVDAEPITGNIDAEQVKAAISDLMDSGKNSSKWFPPKGANRSGKLKGIIGVDVFGQPADFDAFTETAHNYGLEVIEDACEALGAEYHHRSAGLLGDLGVFAFYPNKQITTGEGGMVVTNDAEKADVIRALRNQGRAPGDLWLDHTFLGYNYRMCELSAALGTAQMKRIDHLIAQRQQVASWYEQELADIDALERPVSASSTTRDSWFVYVIRLQKGIDRRAASEKLLKMGIPVRPYFSPIHLQPYMMEKFGFKKGMYPVTEDLGERGLAIPFSGKMTLEQVQETASALRQVLQ